MSLVLISIALLFYELTPAAIGRTSLGLSNSYTAVVFLLALGRLFY